MAKTVFVINAGSSSVKASLLCPSPPPRATKSDEGDSAENETSPLRLVTAHAERLSTGESVLRVTISKATVEAVLRDSTKSLRHSSRASSAHFNSSEDRDNVDRIKIDDANMTHKEAIQHIVRTIKDYDPSLLSAVVAVGHRVVHGGTEFADSAILDDEAIEAIHSVTHLAPLHNPSNLTGIQIAREMLPDTPNVAVFDTSFHSTMPPHVATYPIPREYRDAQIRRYGFHGTSVKYVSQLAAKIIQNHHTSSNGQNRMIVAHLGNGSSVTAVVNGKSVDTTMEFTPLSGVMMGTRSGSIDPAVVTYAAKHLHKSVDEVVEDFNKQSGLQGISNGDNDMRTILERASDGDSDAQLAADMFVYILAKHIAAMLVACGGRIDALVFTAGIGENSAPVRERVVKKLCFLLNNVEIDEALNEAHGKDSNGLISKVKKHEKEEGTNTPLILVVPTDEEAMICEDCLRLIK